MFEKIHHQAFDLLSEYVNSESGREMSTVNDHAIYLLFLKMHLLCQRMTEIPQLISKISAFPRVVISELQKLKTHWAYFYFIKSMELPIRINYVPSFYVIGNFLIQSQIAGDSHVLSLAWRRIRLKSDDFMIHPKVFFICSLEVD